MTTLEKTLAARDLFDSLDGEREQPKERRIEVVKTPALEAMLQGFRKLLDCGMFKVNEENVETLWHVTKIALPDVYSARDITSFSAGLERFAKYSDVKQVAGFYLSSLACNCNENNVVISTRGASFLVDCLGCFNSGKNITVIRDAFLIMSPGFRSPGMFKSGVSPPAPPLPALDSPLYLSIISLTISPHWNKLNLIF